MLLALVLVALCGCRGSFEFGRRRPADVINVPPGATEVVTPSGDEVIEPATPTLAETCFARARHFQGLVPIRCSDLARESRP